MRILLFFLLVVFMSCCSEKTIELPEIKQATITEVIDVSAAYLFYDETKPDSIELNRKNLISTTNWLVNVDKRLTLNQAVPKIKFIQEKKRNSSHKNEAAKNYFTCHDLSQNNLGFIEFTDVHYYLDEKPNAEIEIIIEALDKITIKKNNDVDIFFKTNFKTLEKDLASIYPLETISVTLSFKRSMTFQQYITIKSKLDELDYSKILVDTNEFIY
ncbi:hypothetical protein [Hanstruepera ponticola]|uniref:hypothetical protein n=1 Tax=Hanstruepera ponticola TaxID=2042995 RepID=UPI000CF03C4A|nr:hypothetical protein [Hanstruepera ponticola]